MKSNLVADDMLFLSVSAVFMCSRFFKTRMREGRKAFDLTPWKIPLEGRSVKPLGCSGFWPFGELDESQCANILQ